jgi:hypothetical protein
MKRLLLASALAISLSACATPTGPTTYAAERSATLARASHAQLCQSVETAHATGALKGEPFNRAKLLCVQTDQLLDTADLALAAGDAATAAANLRAANANNTQLKAIAQ